ncbi:DUF6893 family small protein [Amycolatopsis sp. NBC_01307]|jgi:hypothetical protein
MKRLLLLLVLIGGATVVVKLVEPDVRRYLEMSRM